MNDLRFAVRQLPKNPGLMSLVVLMLALGIGANTAIFSIINEVILRPLPYPEPQRLVMLWERNPQRGMEQSLVSGPNFLDWEKQNTVFESMAVNPGWQGIDDFNLLLGDHVLKIKATYASSTFFPTLGTTPLLGRTFSSDEDVKGGSRTAVLSYGLWQRCFNGDANALGKIITLDTYGRRDYTIVGVMPPQFGTPSGCELWLPLGWMGVTLDGEQSRASHWFHVIARLKEGVTVQRARSEMNTIQSRIAQQHPDLLIGTGVRMVPLLDATLGSNLRRALLVIWGVVAGVLIIACTNVANLLLARAAGRRQEIALRVALGASRWRIFRQLLAESFVLSALGCVGGILLAFWLLHAIAAFLPGDIPRIHDVSLDGGALAMTLLVSLLAAVLSGLAPAWESSRAELNDVLKESGRASSGKPVHHLRNSLVVGEIALSLMLLVGAGLMLRSFAKLMLMDRGFHPEHLVTARLDYSVSGFTTWVEPTLTRPQVTQHQLLERLRQRPGIISAAVVWRLPQDHPGPPDEQILIEDRPVEGLNSLPRSDFYAVSPDFFRTLGVPLLRGRDFTEADQLGAPQVAIINQTMARRYFANQDPIGKRLAFPDRNNQGRPESAPWQTNGPWREIIGVVADMKTLGLTPRVVPQTFVPYWQWPMQGPTLLVRSGIALAPLAESIRADVRAVAPNLPPPTILTMDEILHDAAAQPRFQAWLVSSFGILALLLAAVGLYGVLAYMVTQRTNEIGIRMALGAQKLTVLSLVLRQGMKLTLSGIFLGIVGSMATARVMRSLLYEVEPTDPPTFAIMCILLAVVALVACWLPARQAMKIDPLQALRCE